MTQRGRVPPVRPAVLLAVLVSACSSAPPAPPPVAVPEGYPTEYPTAERLPHTPADTRFMTDMMHHHAQALLMAGWAATHDAGRGVRTMAERILVSQQDEIALAAAWLRARGEPVPDVDPAHMMHAAHPMDMPGMLSPEELAQLERARGTAFDRLFLTFMIRHHQGALDMVNALFASWGSAQDEDVFRFASDVYADQLDEIQRMELMLAELDA